MTTDQTIYTTKSILGFGKWKGCLVSGMLDYPDSRNYLIWMKLNGFKMSAQLIEKVDKIHAENKIEYNGFDYERVKKDTMT